MNKSEPQLRINPRIVPQDLLLKFGYSPDNGIKFDSVASTLGFYQGGARRADITSFGLAVRNGEGLVVGHTAQVNAGLGATEFEVLGTADADASMLIGRWGNNDQAPTLSFTKSRDPVIVDGTFAIVSDGDEIGRLYFTADDGTDLSTPAAQIHVEVDGTPGANDMPGKIIFSTTPDGASAVSEALRIDSSQNLQMRNEAYLWIGPDSAVTGFVDAHTTVGLVINQEANDNAIISGKSSDVVHTATGQVEADTFFDVRKLSATGGGTNLRAFSDAQGTGRALNIGGIAGGTVATTAGTTEYDAIVSVSAQVGAGTAPPANSLIFQVVAHATVAFVIDEDGDFFYNGADGGAFDHEDDISLTRAFDLEISDPASLIKSEWDRFVVHKESDLIRTGVLSKSVADGGMVSGRQLARVHNGAIWQLNTQHMSLVERVDELEGQLAIANTALAALTA